MTKKGFLFVVRYALPVVMIAVLAIATFVEKQQGSDYVHREVYASSWFIGLWAALMVGVAFALIHCLRRRQWSLGGLHLSFLLIFVGALFTHATAYSGMLHLRMNTPEKVTEEASFTLTLKDFTVQYYPGTATPSDFISTVTVNGKDTTTATISMNKILRHEGYRFYQTSFDADHEGSIISVSRDPWGIGFTYAGYLVFLLSGIGLLARRGFARGTALLPVALLLLIPTETRAATPVVARSSADSIATEQVIYNGRIAPFNTMARDVVVKIYGKPTFNGLTAEQVVLSFMAYRREWMEQKIIKIKHGGLRDSLGLEGKYACIQDLYDTAGNYRLQQWYSQTNTDKSLRQAIEQTDEKLALLTMLTQGTLFQTLSEDNPHRLSDVRVSAEMAYNAVPLPSILFKVCLSLGFILFLLYYATPRLFARLFKPMFFLQVVLSLALTCYVGLRAYISGHVPLSNGYETMLFIGWLVLLICVFMQRRNPIYAPIGLLLCGFSTLVCSISGMNPQVTSLMPVLASPWMTIHVAVVMIAYALFALALILSVVRLLQRAAHAESNAIKGVGRIVLVAEWFLGVGIALGSVWANVSWGAYWSWDPKEVWALITFIAYAVVLHYGYAMETAEDSAAKRRREVRFDLMAVGAFLLLVMTYFGVNILFSGLHSYA